MICLQAVQTPAYTVVTVVLPQPVDVTACSMVIGNYAETANPWNQLSAVQGAQIAGAILVVWAVGYAFRVLIKSLRTIDEKEI